MTEEVSIEDKSIDSDESNDSQEMIPEVMERKIESGDNVKINDEIDEEFDLEQRKKNIIKKCITARGLADDALDII